MSELTDWEQAACIGQDTRTFFDYEDVRGDTRLAALEDARRICGTCIVQARCLEFALTTGERFGVWGGLTAGERAKLAMTANRTDCEPAEQHRAAS